MCHLPSNEEELYVCLLLSNEAELYVQHLPSNETELKMCYWPSMEVELKMCCLYLKMTVEMEEISVYLKWRKWKL